MAARLRTLQRSAVVLTSASVYLVFTPRTAWAEAPADNLPQKKPIYSRPTPPTTPKPAVITDPLTNTPPSVPEASTPTPTDRLQEQVKHLRLALHSLTVSAEDNFNSALTWTFRKEASITNTIASLAPDPRTGEQLLPGLIYVLVATLAGSIVSRNRNIALRAAFPAAVGITAGWLLIPVTMRNTGDLIWTYEKRVPAIADAHLAVRGFTLEAYKQLMDKTKTGVEYAKDSTVTSRKKIEEIVGQGR